jgi:type VII secretion integral membrane protein EccD
VTDLVFRPPGSPPRHETTGLCHVSVQGPRSRVDLALPAQVPILELSPVLATLCQAGPANGQNGHNGHRSAHAEGTPPAWSLTRVGSEPFQLTSTLAEVGVLDGEVLHLVDVARWRGPAISDVSEAVAGALEDSRRWPGSVGTWLTAVWGAICLAAAAASFIRAAGPGAGTGVLALVGTGALVCMALIPPVVSTRLPARSALLAGAVAFAAVAGWALAGSDGGAAGVSAAAAGAAIALVAVTAVAPAAAGVALVAAVVTVGAGAVARGAGATQVAALMVVGGALVLRLWPAVVSRALSALVPAGGANQAEAAARRSRAMLASLTAGTAILLLASAFVLMQSGNGFAVGLAAIAALALLLRSETYRYVPEALAPALAAYVVLLALELDVLGGIAGPGGASVALVVLTMTGLALVTLSLARPSLTTPPWATRSVWLLVDVVMGPLALGALGVFDQLTRLVHHFLH